MKISDSRRFTRRELLGVSGALTVAAAASSGCASHAANIIESATSVQNKNKIPVVVVGSGIGSLTAAAYAAKSGFPVTVVEQHCVPGGYATSFSRSGGKYTFDVSLHMVSSSGSATGKVLRELGLLEKVSFATLPELCRIVFEDYDIVLPQAAPSECARAIATHFKNEEKGIVGFISELVGAAEDVDRLKKRMSILDKVLFPFRYPYLAKTYNATLADMLDRHIKEPKLKSLLSAFWSYCGLPPSRLSGFYYAMAAGQYVRGGADCYKPRSQSLSLALTALIEAHGGRLILNQTVEEIVLTKGAVSGARLQNGENLKACAVISGAGVPSTFGKLISPDAVPKKYRSRLGGLRPSVSSFVVWLGLRTDIRDRIENYEIFILNGSDRETAYQAQNRGDPDGADLSVTFFDNAFDGYSVPGTSTMSIMFVCGYEPWRPFEIDYFAGRKQAYNQKKENIARTLIARIEQTVLPGLFDMIEVMEVATPLTNLRYTKNPEGAIYGYEQSMDNSFIRRVENRTPVRGLYLAGAWSFPGGGFCGVHTSGRNAFRNFMEDFG